MVFNENNIIIDEKKQENLELFFICIKILQNIFFTFSCILGIMNTNRIYCNSSSGMSAADQNFQNSGWAGHQVSILSFKKLSSKQWKAKCRKIKEAFNLYNDPCAELHSKNFSSRKWLRNFLKVRPDHKRTFIICLFNEEQSIIFLANHSLCDGHVLYSILTIILHLTKDLNTPTYYRIPIYSEFAVIDYVLRRTINHINYNPMPIEFKNRRYSVQLPWLRENRFQIYGKVIDTIYYALEPSVMKIRIAFTVAWNDVDTNSNNRIGAIILDIPRMKDVEQYSHYLKSQFKNKKQDALTSYELIRNYSVSALRKKFCHSIDGVFTGMLFPNHVPGFSHCFGGFAGNLKAPLYINAMSIPQKEQPFVQLSIQTCTSSFLHERIMSLPNAQQYNNYEFPVS